MTELRWALLLAGVLFVAGLVLWERRNRRAGDADRAGNSVASAAPGEADVGAPRTARESTTDGSGRTEPGFSMPGLPRRDPVRSLPVVEIDSRDDPGPGVGELPVFDMGHSNENPGGGFSAVRSRTRSPAEQAARTAPRPDVLPPGEPEADVDVDGDPGQAIPATSPSPDPVERAAAWLADSVPGELPQKPILDWPPEDQRRIVALRVVPRPGERFNGAALRQALVGEGFIHGELDIYHKPIGDGRVVISAASLTRPGTFDPKTIDGLLFAGLNLFSVLPGPLPPRESVERLCLVGRTLAQRLRGDTQDARGQPLTEARVAEMRREASDGAP